MIIGNPIDLNATVTGCASTSTTVLSENFGASGCSGGTGTFPAGWTNTGGKLWEHHSGSIGYGPSSGNGGSGCYAGHDNSTNDNEGLLQTPVIDLSGYDEAELSFYIWQTIPAEAFISINVSTNGGSSFTSDVAVFNTAYASWTQVTVDLDAYAGQSNVVIEFEANDVTDFDSDPSIDDVVVTGINNCNLFWTGPNSFTSAVEDPQVTASATGVEAGMYYLTASSNGCSTIDSVEVLPAGPTIIASPLSLSNLDYFECTGGPSVSQTFTVSGTSLTNDITVTPPANFEVSTDNTNFSTSLTLTQSSGSVANTTIYVRLVSGLSINSYSGNVVLSSTGATNVNVAVSGGVLSDTQDPIANCIDTTIQLDGSNQATIIPELANSTNDFSSTQGTGNWTYGKYPAFSTLSFNQLSNWTGFVWNNPGVGEPLDFPQLDANGGHPALTSLEWAVRRWTSNFTGNIILSGDFYDRDTGCGDGAHVRIFKNTNQVYEYLNIPNSSTNYSIVIPVVPGDKIDLVIDPKFNASCDDTHFTGSIKTILIDNISTDNCSIVSLSVDQEDFDCTDVGSNTITLTVTDNSGGTETCTSNVTIADTTKPTITCSANVSTNVDAGSCVATGVSLGTATTSDNCPGETVSNDAPASFPIGVTTVTWIVTDADNNKDTCYQTVTVSGPSVNLNDPADVCVDGADMNFTGTPTNSNGIFTTTAGAGLTDNGNGTATLDVNAAGAGTYDVTYTYCSGASSTVSVTINALDDASFSYGASSYCQTTDSDPTPTITGLAGGTFSSSPAGLTLNSSTGEIDLSTSSDGSYTITYLTNGTCPQSSNQIVILGCNGSETFSGAPDITNTCKPGDVSSAVSEGLTGTGPEMSEEGVTGFGNYNYMRDCDDDFDVDVDYKDIWYSISNPAGSNDLTLSVAGLGVGEYVAYVLYSADPGTDQDANVIQGWASPSATASGSFFSNTVTTRTMSGFSAYPNIYVRVMAANPNDNDPCTSIVHPSSFTICATLPEPNDECANAINITLNNPTSTLSWFSTGNLNAATNPGWACSWHSNSLGAGTETLKDLWYSIDLITTDGDPSIYSGPYYIMLFAEGTTGDQVITQLMNGCFTGCTAYDDEEDDVLATDTLTFASPDSTLFYNNYQGFGAVASGLPYELRTLDLYDPLYLRVMPIGTMTGPVKVGAHLRVLNDELWRYYDQCIELDFSVENTAQKANFRFASPSSETLADGSTNTTRDLWYHFEPNTWTGGTVPATSFLASVSSTYADITVSGLQTGEEIEFMLYKETTCFDNVLEDQSTYDHTNNYITSLTVSTNAVHRISCLDENYDDDYILRVRQTAGSGIAKPTISVAPSNVMPPENNSCSNIWSEISQSHKIGPSSNTVLSDAAHNYNQFWLKDTDPIRTFTMTGSNDCGYDNDCNGVANDEQYEENERAVWFVFQVPDDQCHLSNNIEATTTSTPGPGSTTITSMTFDYDAGATNKSAKMYVYDGCNGGTLIDCSPAIDGAGDSWTAYGLEQGKYYLLKVKPYNLYSQHDFDFDIKVNQGDVGPCNDDPDNAYPLTVGSCNDYASLDTFSAQGATESAPISGAPESDVWFSFVAPNGANGGPYSYQSSWVTVFLEAVTPHAFYLELYETGGTQRVTAGELYNTGSSAGDKVWAQFGNLIVGKEYKLRVYHKETIGVDAQYRINVYTGPANDPGWQCGTYSLTDASGCSSGCNGLDESWFKLDLPDGTFGNAYWNISVEGQDQHLDFELRSKWEAGNSSYVSCGTVSDGLEGSCSDYDHPCSSRLLEPAVTLTTSTTVLPGCNGDADPTNQSGIERVYFNMNGASPGQKDYYYIRVFNTGPAANGIKICNLSFKGPYSTEALAAAGGAPDLDCETPGCSIDSVKIVSDSLCLGLNSTFTISFDVDTGSGFYDVVASATNATLGVSAGDVLATITGPGDAIGLTIDGTVFGPTTGPQSLFVKIVDQSRQNCESAAVEVIIPACPNCNTNAGKLSSNSVTPSSLSTCFGSDLTSGVLNTEVIFATDYSDISELDPGVAIAAGTDYAFILADASTGAIIKFVTDGNFDFSDVPVGSYKVWQLSYSSEINDALGNEDSVSTYLNIPKTNISQIIADDNDASSGGAGAGSYCLDISDDFALGGTNTITVITSPTITNVDVACSSSEGGATITVTASAGVEYSLDSSTYQVSNVFEGVSNGTQTIYVKSTSGAECVTTQSFDVDCAVCDCPTCPDAPTTADGNIIQISACPVTEGTYTSITDQDVAAAACYSDPACPNNIPFASWKEAVAYTNNAANNVVGVFYDANYYANTVPSPSPYGATFNGYHITKDNVYIDFGGAVMGEDGGEGAVGFVTIDANDVTITNGSIKDYDGTAIYVTDATGVNICNITVDNSDGANVDALQIEANSSSVEINVIGCTFQNNVDPQGGAVGIYNNSSSSLVTLDAVFCETSISCNEGRETGVGMRVSSDGSGGGSDVCIIGGEFYDNYFDAATQGSAGLYVGDNSRVNVEGVEFISNVVDNVLAEGGGAVYLHDGSTVNINRSNFKNNTANGTKGGGAILQNSSSASLTVTNTIFDENGAGEGGAIYVRLGTSATINESYFVANKDDDLTTAASAGGGIYVHELYSGSLAINSNTFSSQDGTTALDNMATCGPDIYLGEGHSIGSNDLEFPVGGKGQSGWNTDEFNRGASNDLNNNWRESEAAADDVNISASNVVHLDDAGDAPGDFIFASQHIGNDQPLYEKILDNAGISYWAFTTAKNSSSDNTIFVLAADHPDLTTASGYAVVFYQTSHDVVLVSFTNGVDDNSNHTPLITYNGTDGTASYSVKVQYDASTDTWTMHLLYGSPVIIDDNHTYDPRELNLVCDGRAATFSGTAVDNSLTNNNTPFIGMAHYSTSTTSSRYGDFDHVSWREGSDVDGDGWSGTYTAATASSTCAPPSFTPLTAAECASCVGYVYNYAPDKSITNPDGITTCIPVCTEGDWTHYGVEADKTIYFSIKHNGNDLDGTEVDVYVQEAMQTYNYEATNLFTSTPLSAPYGKFSVQMRRGWDVRLGAGKSVNPAMPVSVRFYYPLYERTLVENQIAVNEVEDPDLVITNFYWYKNDGAVYNHINDAGQLASGDFPAFVDNQIVLIPELEAYANPTADDNILDSVHYVQFPNITSFSGGSGGGGGHIPPPSPPPTRFLLSYWNLTDIPMVQLINYTGLLPLK